MAFPAYLSCYLADLWGIFIFNTHLSSSTSKVRSFSVVSACKFSSCYLLPHAKISCHCSFESLVPCRLCSLLEMTILIYMQHNKVQGKGVCSLQIQLAFNSRVCFPVAPPLHRSKAPLMYTTTNHLQLNRFFQVEQKLTQCFYHVCILLLHEKEMQAGIKISCH